MTTGTDLDRVLQEALAAHRTGALAEAAEGYRRVLTALPDQPDALHLLGQVLLTAGKPDLGLGLVLRAVAAAPDEASFARTALLQTPALLSPRKAAMARRAIALDPADPTAWLSLAEAEPSSTAVVAALTRAVGDPVALFNAANEAGRQRLEPAAIRGYALAIETSPAFHPAYTNLAALFMRLDHPRRAEPYLTLSLALAPATRESLKNLALVVKGRGRLEDAASLVEKALLLDPHDADGLDLFGMLRLDQGLVEEALAAMDRAAALPQLSAAQGGNRLFALQCLDTTTEADLDRESRAWARRFTGVRVPTGTKGPRGKSRPVRLGLFSGDFRTHSVAYFVKPLLEALDPDRVAVTLFAEQRGGDRMTAALRALALDHVETVGLDDRALAALVRGREIDIALDLAGHTGRNRLTAFALGLAPVQGTWLGYPGTTGLDAMDFRLTDVVADPGGAADRCHAETLVRLPVPFLCYGAPEDSPPPGDGPDGVVFGSFNNRKKLGPATVALWAEVLEAVPGSRLFAKSGSFDDPRTREVFRAAFADAGIDRDRVEAVGWVDAPSGHLGLYDRVTVALDSVPYNGTTTTCEALWMGVPVVTLRGTRHAARVGASLLTAIGRPDWVAEDRAGFVSAARRLAADPPERRAVREILSASPLMDRARFAAAFTTALEDLLRYS
ncbi:MAG: hypothetical protein NXI16_05115 [Alphaproteobacteria bacterium]|nr:hypothetical protein [Alphaproteobacteria bacterium]